MLKQVLDQLKTAFILLVLFTILTGMIYPGVMTAISQFIFPNQANGSLIELNGKVVGSKLIGQSFTDPKYFWSRPSATTPNPYNGAASSGSNMGPSNPAFLAIVKDRIAHLEAANGKNQFIPIDLITASGSGLDPEISPYAAYYQVARIAKARGALEKDILALVEKSVQKRTFGILGEPRINVLQLNIALDQQIQLVPRKK